MAKIMESKRAIRMLNLLILVCLDCGVWEIIYNLTTSIVPAKFSSFWPHDAAWPPHLPAVQLPASSAEAEVVKPPPAHSTFSRSSRLAKPKVRCRARTACRRVSTWPKGFNCHREHVFEGSVQKVPTCTQSSAKFSC